MRETLQGDDPGLARRVLQRFVAKIVIKEQTGTIYYTFPYPDDVLMPSEGNVDLRRLELLTSTVRL